MLQEWEKPHLDELVATLKARLTADEKAELLAYIAFKKDYAKYRGEPYKYTRDVLKVKWLPRQLEIADALLKNKKVMVRSCHRYSNTHTAGGLVNWFFDTRIPSVTLTVSPITDILWKEIRMQRRNRPGLSPKAPRMETQPNHYVQGHSTKDIEGFGGHAENNMLIVFDDAGKIPKEFWDASKSMLTGENHRWVVFVNPSDPECEARAEEMNADSGWKVIESSALDHPNIVAELEGKPPVIEGGVRLAWLRQAIKDWAMEADGELKPGSDFEWPPKSGKFYRPGPECESKVLGRWPTARELYMMSPVGQEGDAGGLDIDHEFAIGETMARISSIIGE